MTAGGFAALCCGARIGPSWLRPAKVFMSDILSCFFGRIVSLVALLLCVDTNAPFRTVVPGVLTESVRVGAVVAAAAAAVLVCMPLFGEEC